MNFEQQISVFLCLYSREHADLFLYSREQRCGMRTPVLY